MNCFFGAWPLGPWPLMPLGTPAPFVAIVPYVPRVRPRPSLKKIKAVEQLSSQLATSDIKAACAPGKRARHHDKPSDRRAAWSTCLPPISPLRESHLKNRTDIRNCSTAKRRPRVSRSRSRLAETTVFTLATAQSLARTLVQNNNPSFPPLRRPHNHLHSRPPPEHLT